MGTKKKFVSILLTMAMVATAAAFPARIASAEETNDVELTLKDTSTAGELQFDLSKEPTSIANDTGLVFTRDHMAAGKDVFYMKNATAYAGIAPGANVKSVMPVGEKSGMWLDGVKLDSSQFDFATAGWSGEFFTRLSSTSGITLQKGNRLTLKGLFTTADGSYTFEMEDITFEYLGAIEEYRWSVVEKPNVELSEEAKDLPMSPTYVQNSDTLYVKCTNLHQISGMAETSNASFTSVGTDSGIYLNGEKAEGASFFGAGWKDAFVIRVNNSSAYEVGMTKIRIQGVWKYGENYFSVRPQQFVYQKTAGTDRWAIDTSYEPEVQVETWTSYTGSILKNRNVLMNEEGTAIGLQVSDTTATSAKITLPAEAVTGDIITISGGFQTDTHSFTLKQVSYLWDGTSWSIFAPVLMDPVKVTGESKATAIYLRLSENLDGEAWKNGIIPLQGKGCILYNGEAITIDVQKGWDENMICIQPRDVTPVKGDTITISGQFKYTKTDGIIDIAPYTIWYDGTTDDGTPVWTSTETAPAVSGDLNYDEGKTVSDLVRFKWYLKNDVAKYYSTVTELTDDDIVDDKDLQEERGLIVKKN